MNKNYSGLCCLVNGVAYCCKCKRKFCINHTGPSFEECPRKDRRRHGEGDLRSINQYHCRHWCDDHEEII